MVEQNTVPAIVAPLPAASRESSLLAPATVIPLAFALTAVGLGTGGCAVADLASMTVGAGMYEKPQQAQVDWIKAHNEKPADMVADILKCPAGAASCVRLVPLGERDNMTGAINVEMQIMEKAARDGVVDVFFFELDDAKYQGDVDHYLKTGQVDPESNLGFLFAQAKKSGAYGDNLIRSLTGQLDIARKYGLDAVCVDVDLGGGRDTTEAGIAERDQHIWEKTSEYYSLHPQARGIMRLGATHIRQPAPLVKNGVGDGVKIHTVEIITDEMEGASGAITPIKALEESGVGDVAAIRNVGSSPLASMRNDFSDSSLTFGSSGIGSIIIVHGDGPQAGTSEKKITGLETAQIRERLQAFYRTLMFILFGTDASPRQKSDWLDMWVRMPKEGETFMLGEDDIRAIAQLRERQKTKGSFQPGNPKPFDPYGGRVNKPVHSSRYTGNNRR